MYLINQYEAFRDKVQYIVTCDFVQKSDLTCSPLSCGGPAGYNQPAAETEKKNHVLSVRWILFLECKCKWHEILSNGPSMMPSDLTWVEKFVAGLGELTKVQPY